MINLKNHIELLKDKKRQHKIIMFRYYTRDSQTILFNLIAKEIESWPLSVSIPFDLYSDLANPENLATKSIENLFLLYRKVVMFSVDSQDK
jgi:hypothetical protein